MSMAQQQAADRPLRNVFVGNIPYDATEEKLREIFTTVGPVLSFRLVYDRETGKPKGYGFCEYKDQETAASAIRNLNGYDINGRQLRVDSASDVRGREEELRNSIPNAGGAVGPGSGQSTGTSAGGPGGIGMNSGASGAGPAFHEAPHSNEIEPDKAPETISKVMASLPPEQMFELAKQMKQTIQNNPNEARAMLVQNPQLSYALLQALIVMRSIDPQMAMNLFHKQMAQQIPVATFIQAGTIMAPTQPAQMVPVMTNVMPGMPMQQANIGPQQASIVQGMPIQQANIAQQQSQMVQGMPMQVPLQQGVPGQPMMVPAFNPQQYNIQQASPATSVQTVQSNDPRLARGRGGSASQPQQQQPPQPQPQQPQQAQQNVQMSDQQKAELILQVIRMTNEQIAQLPPDQQQKIYMLREQVRANTLQ